MRTIFMGSPEFAVASLEKVHELTDLQAVYTQPDKVRFPFTNPSGFVTPKSSKSCGLTNPM